MQVFLADLKAGTIKTEEVMKVTGKTLTMTNGSRKDIRTKGSEYFTSFEDARAWLVLNAIVERQELEFAMKRTDRKLESVRALVQPSA